MVKNNGMKSIFGRIGLKKFVGFGGGFGWGKGIVGGNNLENNGRNNWILSMDNSE